MFDLFVRFALGFLLVFMALFLIALVLIQRGRGGGLAGAFGGAGGQSAFGTKAGDVFTRITVLVASLWILLCILASNVLSTNKSKFSPALGGAAAERVKSEVETPPASDTPQKEPTTDSKDKPDSGDAKPGPESGEAKQSDADGTKPDAVELPKGDGPKTDTPPAEPPSTTDAKTEPGPEQPSAEPSAAPAAE